MAGNELVKAAYIHWLAAVVDKSANAVFLSLALIVVIVVMLVVVFFVMVLLVVVMVVMLILVFFLVVIVVVSFKLIDPSGRGGHFVEVECIGVQNAIEVDVAVVAIDDFGFGLYGVDDFADAAQLSGFHFGGFVEQNDVAEFYLLYDKVLYVVLSQAGAKEVFAAAELVLHTQCVDDGDDAIHYRDSVANVFRPHCGDGADGLSDGLRLAYAAGLDDNVVEAVLAGYVAQLLNEVHLQGAADASVLQGYEAFVLFVNDAAFLYEISVYVNLAYIVDYYGETYASFVAKNAVEKCCFATAKIAGQQQYGYFC
jgi:hypothetical protein